MIKQLPLLPVPDWLSKASANSIKNDPFPLDEILADSLYYPSSGFDGDPVKHLGGNVLSFIYVDYGRSKEKLLQDLKEPGFRGYKIIGRRDITKEELIPHGWRPSWPTLRDGDPPPLRQFIEKPYAYWVVLERCEDFPDAHGPDHFSLLYLYADGVAGFQALYISNQKAPKFVAIIQPGNSFGHNWTDYSNPGLIFARSVLENPAGTPQYLLYGGMGRRERFKEPCWPEYGKFVTFFSRVHEYHGYIGLWKRSD